MGRQMASLQMADRECCIEESRGWGVGGVYGVQKGSFLSSEEPFGLFDHIWWHCMFVHGCESGVGRSPTAGASACLACTPGTYSNSTGPYHVLTDFLCFKGVVADPYIFISPDSFHCLLLLLVSVFRRLSTYLDVLGLPARNINEF